MRDLRLRLPRRGAGQGPPAPDDGAAFPPGAGRLGLFPGPNRGPRAHSSFHHRRRGRDPAPGQRGREPLDRLQRGDLQLRRAGRRAEIPGPRLPHGLGHRGGDPRLGGVGPGVLPQVQRPVGPGALGPPEPGADPLPGPRGDPSPVLRFLRRPLPLRLGDESPLRRSLPPAGLRPRRPCRNLLLLVPRCAPDSLPGYMGARAGPLGADSGRRNGKESPLAGPLSPGGA